MIYLRQAVAQLALAIDPFVELWQVEVGHSLPLIEQIITQTERRVLAVGAAI